MFVGRRQFSADLQSDLGIEHCRGGDVDGFRAGGQKLPDVIGRADSTDTDDRDLQRPFADQVTEDPRLIQGGGSCGVAADSSPFTVE